MVNDRRCSQKKIIRQYTKNDDDFSFEINVTLLRLFQTSTHENKHTRAPAAVNHSETFFSFIS